jgi:hypothetical protein
MSVGVVTGIFAIVGALVGGLLSYLSARIGHRWGEAKSEIRKLSEQVAAYHRLEGLYKSWAAEHDPDSRAPKKIQEDMRREIEEIGGYVRPRMTATEAREIMEKWS